MHAIKLVVWCPFCDWAGYAPVSEKGPSMRDYQCPKCGRDLDHLRLGKTPSGEIAKLKEARDNIRREGKVKQNHQTSSQDCEITSKIDKIRLN